MGWISAAVVAVGAALAWLWRAWRRAVGREKALERQNRQAEARTKIVSDIIEEREHLASERAAAIEAASGKAEEARVLEGAAAEERGRLEAASGDAARIAEEANRRLRERRSR